MKGFIEVTRRAIGKQTTVKTDSGRAHVVVTLNKKKTYGFNTEESYNEVLNKLKEAIE